MPRTAETIGASIRRKEKEGSRHGFVPRGDPIGRCAPDEPKAVLQVDNRAEE